MIRETTYNEIFDAQRHFRLIMDSMANPGKLVRLEQEEMDPPQSLGPASALIGFALLNADVTFFTAHNKEAITDYFTLNTAAVSTEAHQADFIFLHGHDTPEILRMAKRGDDHYPETSAFIIIEVDEISQTPHWKGLEVVLKGPGVEGTKKVYIQGLSESLLRVIQEKNADYPLGVDTLITDKQHQLLCIPRSNQFSMSLSLLQQS